MLDFNWDVEEVKTFLEDMIKLGVLTKNSAILNKLN